MDPRKLLAAAALALTGGAVGLALHGAPTSAPEAPPTAATAPAPAAPWDSAAWQALPDRERSRRVRACRGPGRAACLLADAGAP